MNVERTPLLAANWKQNQTWEDCERYVDRLRQLCPEYFKEESEPAIELLICPPFPYLTLLGGLLDAANIYVGAQDASRFPGGAYTGEVSAAMLADAGCDYAIAGHSERRHVLGEPDSVVTEKVRLLREAEVAPLLCVGEPLDIRDAGNAKPYTISQLDAATGELKLFEPGGFVIAYEPVWAIGTGRSAEPADAQEMSAAIRGWLRDHLGKQHAQRTLVLYGGSVKPENIAGYAKQKDIDGALIGGASLKAESFVALLRACEKVL